ncbi:MAG: UDP-N-acetylglucosamine 2-epimerase (hydrolyzing) [Deltaproteobacteria bacterium]|nr:UDP-N-acetylglucosamine 2-epimerase (hydrolyzing) [Deltaproteobacteria bacterium]
MTAEKKKILFITGTRADFGKLKPLMEKVENSSEFECYIFSTGMHTLSRYGSTYDEILKSGFRNVFLYINQMANQSSAMDIILANTINGFGHYVREFSPDLIVVHGDRVETLAGAIVGTLNNILVAHIEGGEVSGTVDELLRHAVSKLAHIHFVANEESLQRLIQMGEVKDSIYVIGSPDIDVMLSDRLPSLHEAKQYYGIPFDEYFLFLYHPVTTELHQLVNGVDAIVGTLEESGKNFIVVYPNHAKGSELILEALLKLEGNEHFRPFPSLRFEYFLTLLRPTEKTTSLHFGSGKSSEKFINIIKQSAFWQRSCQKQFQDLVIPQLRE